MQKALFLKPTDDVQPTYQVCVGCFTFHLHENWDQTPFVQVSSSTHTSHFIEPLDAREMGRSSDDQPNTVLNPMLSSLFSHVINDYGCIFFDTGKGLDFYRGDGASYKNMYLSQPPATHAMIRHIPNLLGDRGFYGPRPGHASIVIQKSIKNVAGVTLDDFVQLLDKVRAGSKTYYMHFVGTVEVDEGASELAETIGEPLGKRRRA